MRIENSIRNILFGLGGYILNILIGFVTRSLFIKVLGIEYLGINGLFTNILMLLNLTELGIGAAIIFSLYKPLADKDEYRVAALMNLYKKAYRMIGIAVLTGGLVLAPFLGVLIKDMPDIPHITIIYILFLLQSVVSYLFFAYKSSIINASQNNYIISKYGYIYTICNGIMQVLLLLVTQNYILILTVQIGLDIMRNILIARQADRMYPFLKKYQDAKLQKEEVKKIYKDVYALSLSKICNIVLNGTDNIVISYFLGIVPIGIYSNYMYLINSINSILNIVFTSITSSVGNLNVTSDEEKKYLIYRVMNFVVFWFYGFCAISFFELLNPFISIWLGEQYLFGNSIVFIIILNFYTAGMQYTNTIYKDACGLFWNTRYRSLCMAIINIVSSVILVQYIGIAGVFLGTIISRLTTNFWFDPWTIHKNVFNKSLKNYFYRYLMYTGSVIIAGVVTVCINKNIIYTPIITLTLRGIVCLVVPNLIFVILFFRTSEFKYIKDIIFSKVFYKFRAKYNSVRG